MSDSVPEDLPRSKASDASSRPRRTSQRAAPWKTVGAVALTSVAVALVLWDFLTHDPAGFYPIAGRTLHAPVEIVAVSIVKNGGTSLLLRDRDLAEMLVFHETPTTGREAVYADSVRLEFGSPDERSLHRLLSDCVRRASDTDAPLVRQPTLTRGRRNLDRRAVNALVARLAAGFDPAALTPAPPDAKEKQGR